MVGKMAATKTEKAKVGGKGRVGEMIEYLKGSQARIAELEAALEIIACRHVTNQPLWWQIAARLALKAKP